jgi:hypothetical protein
MDMNASRKNGITPGLRAFQAVPFLQDLLGPPQWVPRREIGRNPMQSMNGISGRFGAID